MTLNWIFTVARFEWVEALRSRLAILLVLIYGVGSAAATALFLNILREAEATARHTIADQLQLDPGKVPQDLVQDQAMPWLISLVEDPSTREQLKNMDPLSIFFGWGALHLAAFLVFSTATSSVAAEVGSGATRFVLFRCERLAYCLGKALGQAVLFGAGLLLAALVCFATGVWLDEAVELERAGWLLRTAFRAWVYGLCYLGIFLGVSMTARSRGSARARAAALWLLLSIAHTVLTAQWFNARVPGAERASVLFPSHHQAALWSGQWLTYLGGVAALLVLGMLGFIAGYRVFQRQDA